MMPDVQFYLVDPNVLPEVFQKVMEAKYLINSGRVKTSSEACKVVGISRSVFYKYRNHIFPYEDNMGNQIYTLGIVLSDEPGVLSLVLTELSKFEANILTVNQNIPNQNFANVTMSITLRDERTDIKDIIDSLSKIHGVTDIKTI